MEYLTTCAMCALFFERPEDIKHPTDQRIPRNAAGTERCIELVAPVKLMDNLQIDEGSEVEVAVSAAS